MATVLITGTSTGIGLSSTLMLARAGHKVFATMRDPVRAPQLGETVAAEGLPVEISVLDVNSDESVATAVDAINEPIDVLINNAGIEATGSVEHVPQDTFRSIMETNYFGVIRCIQAILPDMRERQDGCIINVTSVAGRIAAAPFAPYTASKHALEALSECLAQEVKAFNIRVAIVEPGIIDTPMARRLETPEDPSVYPQEERLANLFNATLQNPASPSLVADKILDIVDSGTWQLRHPVGPDAIPFLEWRAAMTDEQWADWGALEEEAWYDRVEADFGLKARPEDLG